MTLISRAESLGSSRVAQIGTVAGMKMVNHQKGVTDDIVTIETQRGGRLETQHVRTPGGHFTVEDVGSLGTCSSGEFLTEKGTVLLQLRGKEEVMGTIVPVGSS